jgi:hypothetical protein
LGLEPLLLLGPLALARAAQVALEALDLRPQRVTLGRDLAQPAVGLEEPQLQRRVLADLGAGGPPRGPAPRGARRRARREARTSGSTTLPLSGGG